MIWEEEGLGATTVRAAFVRGRIAYEVIVDVWDEGRSSHHVASDLALSREVILTLEPY